MSLIPERHALQPERTALAWQRTALTSIMLLLPLLVVATRVGAWWLLAAGSAAAIVGAVLARGVRTGSRSCGTTPAATRPTRSWSGWRW